VVVVVFMTVTCTANGGHWVSPGGLQAYSLPQPWLCRAPSGGHVLRETTGRGLCGLVCPSVV